MAREFSLLIDSNCTMQGLQRDAALQGSGQMGRVDLVVVFSRRSGEGGTADEGHFLHVRATQANWFDDQNPITSIRYDAQRASCTVTQCTVLRA